MAKLHRPLSDQSKAYKAVETIFDDRCAPEYLEDGVIHGLPFEEVYGKVFSWKTTLFQCRCEYEIYRTTRKIFKDESVKRYIRHIVAKRRKEYEVLVSKPFLWRLWYFITRTVRGK